MYAFLWHTKGRGQMTVEKMMDDVVAWALDNSDLRAISEVIVLRKRVAKGDNVRAVEVYEAIFSKHENPGESLYLH